jgi:hypothetical protein
MKELLENIANVSTALGLFGLFGVFYQLWSQRKKDRTELILRLTADFFNNHKFMSLFKKLDSEKLSDVNNFLKKLIAGECVDNLQEIDLSSYLNFFNSLAILVEDKIVTQSKIMELFRYQLEKTFASIEMIRYMEDYGFERIKKLLPNSFFFYGTLESESERDENVKVINSFLKNGDKIDLKGYTIEGVGPKNEYKGLVVSKGTEEKPIKGSLVRIVENANWTELFDTLDEYEDVKVDELYVRAIIRMEVRNYWRFEKEKYAWTYLKKR